MKFIVGPVDEIPPGGRKIVRVAGRSIGVFNVGGRFYAIRNRCPHQGAALCEGKLWGVLKADVPGNFQYDASKEILACPWHGWEFSVKTGQSWCEPKRLRVRRYDVSVEDRTALELDAPVAAEDTVKIKTVVAGKPAPAADEPPARDPEAPAPGMVKGPYVVETFPVSVEGGYLYLVIDVADVAASPPTRSGTTSAT